MDSKRSAVHAGKYFLITTGFAVVGLAFVAAGFAMSQPVLETTTPGGFVSAAMPGIVLSAVGLLVYRFGESWALYKTLTDAHEEALAETFDTQRVKSDIVSVLDDRLSDMQNDLQSVNRELRKLRDDEQFQFGTDSDD